VNAQAAALRERAGAPRAAAAAARLRFPAVAVTGGM